MSVGTDSKSVGKTRRLAFQNVLNQFQRTHISPLMTIYDQSSNPFLKLRRGKKRFLWYFDPFRRGNLIAIWPLKQTDDHFKLVIKHFFILQSRKS